MKKQVGKDKFVVFKDKNGNPVQTRKLKKNMLIEGNFDEHSKESKLPKEAKAKLKK